jgi:uncharacterized protein
MSVLPTELLDILRCSRCKGTLRLVEQAESCLECNACRLRYAIRNGIPIMLLDEATTI